MEGHEGHAGMGDMSGMTTQNPHSGHTGPPMGGGHPTGGGVPTGGGGGHQMPHMSMMKMYFHTGLEETVLFEQWKITDIGTMIGSCVGIFILAALYEGLKVLREYLIRKHLVSVRYSAYNMPCPSGSSQEAMVMGEGAQNGSQVHYPSYQHRLFYGPFQQKMFSLPHLIQTLLHVIQIVISYFLMLIFMTYNVWLCLAVGLGAGTGYFIFGWKKAVIVDVNEHCH